MILYEVLNADNTTPDVQALVADNITPDAQALVASESASSRVMQSDAFGSKKGKGQKGYLKYRQIQSMLQHENLKPMTVQWCYSEGS